MFRAIDPSEYLRRTNANDFPHRFFENDCLPEVLRRIYRHFCERTGTIADNHLTFFVLLRKM
jgi:hypothetical protein